MTLTLARRARLVTAALALLAAAGPALARDPYSPDRPEPGSVEAIAAATTETRFASPWVAHLPDSDSVPSPSEHLGHMVGAPGVCSSTRSPTPTAATRWPTGSAASWPAAPTTPPCPASRPPTGAVTSSSTPTATPTSRRRP